MDCMLLCVDYCRYGGQLEEEESSTKETFLERCIHNPSLRDRYPILTRNFETKKKVRTVLQ